MACAVTMDLDITESLLVRWMGWYLKLFSIKEESSRAPMQFFSIFHYDPCRLWCNDFVSAQQRSVSHCFFSSVWKWVEWGCQHCRYGCKTVWSNNLILFADDLASCKLIVTDANESFEYGGIVEVYTASSTLLYETAIGGETVTYDLSIFSTLLFLDIDVTKHRSTCCSKYLLPVGHWRKWNRSINKEWLYCMHLVFSTGRTSWPSLTVDGQSALLFHPFLLIAFEIKKERSSNNKEWQQYDYYHWPRQKKTTSIWWRWKNQQSRLFLP